MFGTQGVPFVPRSPGLTSHFIVLTGIMTMASLSILLRSLVSGDLT